MMEKLFFKNLNFYIFLSICISCITFAIVSFDTTFFYHWYTFSLWIISILVVPVFFCIQKRRAITRSIKTFLASNHLLPFLFIIFLAIIFSFSFLVRYPYISIYDQVRDGGLNAQEILNGSIKNIFGYARYGNKHGLIIPVVTSFFYLFFQNSVLTFRFPAAIIAVIDTIILYMTAYTLVGKKAAFWSSLILLTTALHIFYARTEIVVIFSSLLTSIMFLCFGLWLQRQNRMYAIFLGLFIGLSLNFHASVKIVGLIIMFFSLIFTYLHMLDTGRKKERLMNILLLILFFFIGFGPKILFTTIQNFFVSTDAPQLKSLLDYFQSYQQSLLVYIGQPLWSTNFPVYKTLITPIISAFFLIGILFSIFSKNLFVKFLVIMAIIIPFTNSALTNTINSDNRLAPLFPIVAMLGGYGIEKSLAIIKQIKYGKKVFVVLEAMLCFFIILQGIFFFLDETATKQYGLADYVSMHMIYFVNDNASYNDSKTLCIAVSPSRYSYLQYPTNLLLVAEQYEYFLPGKTISIYEGENIRDNETYIASSCDLPKTIITYTFCRQNEKFTCVNNQQIKILINNDHQRNDGKERNFFLQAPLIIYPTPTFIP